MENKKIKKSEVAQLRGMSYKTADIAKYYGITLEETVNTLKSFGLYKTKATTEKTKNYTIELVDDINTNAVMVEFAGEIPELTERD